MERQLFQYGIIYKKKEVMAYSPTIAGRLAASTAISTPEEIAKQIKELFEEGEQ